jgi:hypothetical protein
MPNRFGLWYFTRFKKVYRHFNDDNDVYFSAYMFLSLIIGNIILGLSFVWNSLRKNYEIKSLMLVMICMVPLVVLTPLIKKFKIMDKHVKVLPDLNESLLTVVCILIISVLFALGATFMN